MSLIKICSDASGCFLGGLSATEAICSTEQVEACAFVVTGGASTSFLKADGTVDSATYTTNVGDITNVIAGDGLSGGATSGAATIGIDGNAIGDWDQSACAGILCVGDILGVSAGVGIDGGDTTGSITVCVAATCNTRWNGTASTVQTNSATWGGGSSNLEILDEGGSLTSTASAINFVGAGVAATNVGAIQTVTINGGGSSSLEILDEGGSLTSTASAIDFVGAGVTASNVGAVQTVTIAGGGSSSLEILDEGSSLTSTASAINFTGAGVTVTNVGAVQTADILAEITGGGTTGTFPQFCGAKAIGDSCMSQSGTVISIDGTLSARSLCASDPANNNIWSSVGLPNITTASNNTAIGEDALCDLFSGSCNTAIGTSTMAGNTSGSNNVALGDSAMFYALSGDHNFALGQYTLYDNYGGDFNSAIGTAALQCNTTGSNNTALGYRALLNNTTGNDNTAIGECAIDSNVNGIGNTAFGNKALGGNVTGNYNIAIGQCAGAYFADGCTALSGSDDSIYIGRDTRAKDHDDYNTIVIGLSACSCGANTVKMGNGGITDACIQVGWTTVSDERDKKDITDLDKGLTFIGDLKPKAFKMRAARGSRDTQGGCRYGFIAQEVLETEGTGIIVSDNNPDHLGMNQEFLIPILVKGMQEQQEIINDLRERVEHLETVEALEL